MRQASGAPVLVLTGAGISAESGIPTFRGPEGYWKVGSREYRPMELATRAAFAEIPDEVWGWYLNRRATCRAAEPNAAHDAIARLEQTLGDRFTLVTQNVDGLHLRAGNTHDRTCQIHGNIDFMRCANGCTTLLQPLSEATGDTWARGQLPDESLKTRLRCPTCKSASRPHVLWFDECYDETLFRAETALRAAQGAGLLIVVGTSGATNLPAQICHIADRRGIPLIVIDPEPTPFTELVIGRPAGRFLRGTACDHVPAVARHIVRIDAQPQ